MDWGTGKVTDVGDAGAGDGAYCDGCDNSITTGLVYDVVLTPYGASKGRVGGVPLMVEKRADAGSRWAILRGGDDGLGGHLLER